MSFYSIIHTTVHKNYHSDIIKCMHTFEDMTYGTVHI
jgi:hypothetical protein